MYTYSVQKDFSDKKSKKAIKIMTAVLDSAATIVEVNRIDLQKYLFRVLPTNIKNFRLGDDRRWL